MRRISRPSRRSVAASRFSTFHATFFAKPPPKRLDVPRTPSCILGVISDFAIGLRNLWRHPVTAATPRGSRPCGTPTGPLKHPRALPQRDSGNDGTMRRPVAAIEAHRSQPPSVADDRCRWSVLPLLAITRLDDHLRRVERQISSRPHLSAPSRKLALTEGRVSTMTDSLRRNSQQPEAGTDNTTRRFCARPCGVSFETTGFASPNP